MRVEIGKMCHKGRGHLSIIGENDHGACGSHYYATVYIELNDGAWPEDAANFEQNATEAGRDLAAQLNRLEDLTWAAFNDEEEKK